MTTKSAFDNRIPKRSDLRDYTISLDWKFDRRGALDLLPAGKQDASYSSRVNSFDWENFYNRLGGGVFLEAVREPYARVRDSKVGCENLFW